MQSWVAEARALFDQAYGVDWPAHIRNLNQRLNLTGDYDLLDNYPRIPEFFWGDLESFRPREWVAVISLNPQVWSEKWHDWYDRTPWSADLLWRYLTRQELFAPEFSEADYFYTKFARPLSVLSAGALRIADPLPIEVEITMRRTAFFETLPYSSRMFRPDAARTIELAHNDIGSRTALGIAATAIRGGAPAAVLLNGIDVVNVFPAVSDMPSALTEVRYESEAKPGKRLRHWEGAISTDTGSVPVVGFPHLHTQSGHNSNIEVQQLARRVAELTHIANR